MHARCALLLQQIPVIQVASCLMVRMFNQTLAAVLVQVDAEDMKGTVATFLRLPVHEVKHPEFGTLMRMLDSEEPFSIGLAKEATET